jgi:diguanylate cyclase (GGDEF)-like protein
VDQNQKVNDVGRVTSKAARLAASHVITSCATLAAILLFVGIGSQIVPAAIAGIQLPASSASLKTAFLLNIAIILFGWRRSKDLRDALDAHERAERDAQRNANTDPTTGLANRRELLHSLAEKIETRSSGILVLLDLDHFKRVNDLHGHSTGDQLLCAVADVVTGAAPAGSCCARIGGDEYAIIIDSAEPSIAEGFAGALVERLSMPLPIGNIQAHVSASIGLAAIEKSDKDDEALRRCDVALYAAKRAGRNGFAWFNQELELELTDRLKLEEDIRSGIENGEFVPFFQPLIDLSTRDLVGFEALARWKSPSRGLLEPASFMETAETTGLIGPLTISVMQQALEEARNWPQHLKIAVNVSPVQFRDRTLAQQLLKVLAATGFPASRFEIEITEASLLEDRDQVTTIIHSLQNVGVSICLQDFGTGYASLAQLHTLPVDRVKIDKAFINTMVKSGRTDAIVGTIAALGHKLNVPITAEGVESEQIRGEISKLGCSEAQGWLFGRAVSAATVNTFLQMNGGISDTAVPGDEILPPQAAPERKRM